MCIQLKDNVRCLSLISCGVLCATLLSAQEPKVQQRVQAQAAQPQRIKQLVQVQAAAGAQIVARGGWGQGNWDVREEVDPNNPVERFLLLLPGGPVIVQATMTIDGEPYQVRREKLIDEMLATADTSGDGKPTWDEALAAPRFTLGRVRIANALQRKQFLTALDRNSDGIVDRPEVRRFIAQYSQGPAFVVGGTAGGGGFGRVGAVVVASGQVLTNGGGTAEAREFLDTDSDGVLSPAEIKQAGDRLKSRDADDNDLLYSAELAGNVTGGYRLRANDAAPGRRLQPTQDAALLGPEVKAETLYAALQKKYRTSDDGPILAEAFSAVPGLFAQLDANKNGQLDEEEVLALNTIPAHIELAVVLGEPAAEAGLTVTATEGLPEIVTTPDAVWIELPGVKLTFDTKSPVPPMISYAQSGKQYLTQFDKDGNGYLEKSELPDQLGPQFDVWDEDGDGKVYEREIVASYTRMMAPQLSQVRANVTASGDPLFGILDQSGDGRLSLREMKTAPERIRTLDRDGDGRIAREEIPESWSLGFDIGYAQYAAVRVQQPGAVAGTVPPRDGTPEWFTRMDRNGDGDVTLREFLGGRAKFEELDADHDGFLEPAEAAKASPPESSTPTEKKSQP